MADVISGKLPAMTDPLGKHWRQPRDLRERVVVYETHATISERDFFQLSNYQTTMPSGVYPGKAWRQGRKFLCWYGPDRNRKCRVCCVRVLHPNEEPKP